jgi:glycosyltransferase involved in cell wall biosynthesis
MRIGIDARSVLKRRTGVGNYTFNLFQNLGKIDQENRYVLFYSHHKNLRSAIPQIENVNFESKFVRLPNKLLNLFWRTVRYPSIETWVGKVDVFHSPNFELTPQKQGRSVLTIHDLCFLVYEKYAIKSARLHYGRRIKSYAQRADVIITVSENSKGDIINYLGIPPETIFVIPEGKDDKFKPQNDPETVSEIRNKYGLRRAFILHVGTLEPRKNLVGLIRAYHRSRARKEYQLVMAGGKGWMYKEIFKTVGKLGLSREVIFTGYVPEDDLPALYNASSLFVFPSLYEGFGLPPLEAMACGTPVITSSVSSLPEVTADAAILVDPFNIEEIKDSIDSVLSDQELASSLKKKGLERAALFTWEKTAQKTLEVYRRVLAK